MRFTRSYKIYKQRRAKYQMAKNIEEENSQYPDFLTPQRYIDETTDLRTEMDMERTREKYSYLNFEAVKQVLK